MDDTAALQRAIDAGGTVEFPGGTYLTGTLYLRSNVTLELADDAKILATTDPSKWNRRDFCPQNLAYQPDWCSGAHLICAVGITNVTVRGGTIDGNGRSFFTNAYHLGCCGRKQLNQGPFRPRQMLYFCESSDLRFEKIRLVNSAFWNLFLHGCENVEIDGLTIRSDEDVGENDGIDIDCCRHVRVRNCDIEVGDDGVTTRGAYTGLTHRRVCEDVEVSDCTVKSFYAHAIRVGVGLGEIKDVAFRRMRLRDTRGAIWVCPKYSDARKGGCNIHDILFEDIDFTALCWLFVQSDYRFVKKDFFEGEIGQLTFRRVRGRSQMPRSIKMGADARLVPPIYEACEIDEGEARLLPPNELEFFLYSLPDVERLDVKLEDVKARLARMPAGHPRLFVPSRDAFVKLRATYRENPEKVRLADFIIGQADKSLSEPPIERTMEGNRMRGQEFFQRRVWDLAGAYLLTADGKYAAAALREVRSAAKWPDWNPRHFLDTSKMLCGMAVIYDWLYDELKEEDRVLIREAIVRLGLDTLDKPGMSWWRDAPSNWQQACWAGVCAAALAIWETDPERCAKLLHEAVVKLPLSASAYAPNGAYPEGPQYWGYGTIRFILTIDLLENALGTDFGLRNLSSFLKTGEYMTQVTGPSEKLFNYSDNGDRRKFEAALVWLFNRTGQKGLEQAEWRRARSGERTWYGNFPMLLFSWHDFDLGDVAQTPEVLAKSPSWCGETPHLRRGGVLASPDGRGFASTSPLSLDYSPHGHNPIVCSRSDWTEKAAFVAAKGGRAAYCHGHQDVGTFVFDLDGVRWVEELGNQEYHQVEKTGMDFWDYSPESKRWTVFRLSPCGHNLVTIGDYDLNVDGFAPIVEEVSAPDSFVAKIDLEAVYRRRGATSASRMVRLDRKLRTATIEDRFGGIKPETRVQWSAITGVAKVSVDGDVVRLEDGKGHSAQIVAKGPAKVTWQVTDISNPLNEWDAPNPGRKRLSFSIPASADGSFASVVTLGP